MNCKHNKILSNGTLLYCTHCGRIIQEGNEKTCKQKTIIKQIAKTTMEADAQVQTQKEENTNIVCLKHVLDLNQEGETQMTKPRCKMSVMIDWCDDEYKYCAAYKLVKCEGSQEDRRNCPFWKGAGEP